VHSFHLYKFPAFYIFRHNFKVSHSCYAYNFESTVHTKFVDVFMVLRHKFDISSVSGFVRYLYQTEN